LASQEDKIYENPADESRAPELWTDSDLWLKVEKLMYIHLNVVKEMRNMTKEVAGEDPQEGWFAPTPGEFERLASLVQEDLIKPTANLSDMVSRP